MTVPTPTRSPQAPAAQPITPPGAELPLQPSMPKQDPQWGVSPSGTGGYPQNNKVVDTMTAETEALTQKVAAVQAELANKDVVIKEKDTTIIEKAVRIKIR